MFDHVYISAVHIHSYYIVYVKAFHWLHIAVVSMRECIQQLSTTININISILIQAPVQSNFCYISAVFALKERLIVSTNGKCVTPCDLCTEKGRQDINVNKSEHVRESKKENASKEQ